MDEKQIYLTILNDLFQRTALSNKELAEKTGCTERYVYYLKKGKHRPSLKQFCKILKALGEDPVNFVIKVVKEMDGNESDSHSSV